MMTNTIVGLFQEFRDAQSAVEDLVNAGFRREEISLAAGQVHETMPEVTETEQTVGQDAGVGAEIGGIVGLLVGVAALTVPGIGPILAAGPITAALGTALGSTVVGVGVGAVTGGLVGGLTHLGVDSEQAEYYAAGIKHGSTLVIIHTAPENAETAKAILHTHGGRDQANTVRETRETMDTTA